MQLYDAIFYRKSTKKFSKNRVSIPMFDEIKNICEKTEILKGEMEVKVHPILKGDSLKFIIKKHSRVIAPHYLLITSKTPEDAECYLENIGYVGEDMVLKLTELGLATCWIGDSFNKVSVNDFVILEEEEIPVALIAFGFPEKDKQLFRQEGDKLDRKKIKDIAKNVDEKWLNPVECVRLAPSYKNDQPWKFYQNNGRLDLYIKKNKHEDINKINIGIALKHFEIGCQNNNIYFKYEDLQLKKKLSRNYYISII